MVCPGRVGSFAEDNQCTLELKMVAPIPWPVHKYGRTSRLLVGPLPSGSRMVEATW